MTTNENISFTTVGRLLTELKKFEKKWNDYVSVWIPDGSTLGIIGMGFDKDGDLRIELEEQEDVLEGFWTVDDTIHALKQYQNDINVYFSGCGLYFCLETNHDGSIFMDGDDDYVIGCYAYAFGKYDLETCIEPPKKRSLKDLIETIVLFLIILIAILGIAFNIIAMCANSGGPLWEKILWIIGFCVILIVCSATLYYSKK